MKTIFLKIVFLIVVLTVILFPIQNYGLSSENNWIIVSRGGEDTTYFDIQFVGKKGWIVGWKWDVGGIILHTEDGGNTWTEQIIEENAKYGFRALYFIDENEGWVVGGGSFDFNKRISKIPYIYHTTDGGNTWAPIPQRIINSPFKGSVQWENLREDWSLLLTDVYFVSSGEGWLIGGPDVLVGTPKHFLFHSSDTGKTWTGKYFSEILNKIYFINPEEGWLFTETSFPFHTVDNGKTFQPRTDLPTFFSQFPNIVSIQFISPEEGFFFDLAGNIYHTKDSGVTFEVLRIDKLKHLESVRGGFFVNSKVGWVFSNWGKIIHTADHGKTWQVLDDADLVTEKGIWLHNLEYVPITGEIWALGKGSRFEPYILRYPSVMTFVNPQGKIPSVWGEIKKR